MHNGHGYSPSRSRNQSSRRNMRDVSGPVVPSTPRDTGDGEHLRRRTTFTTKPPTRRDDHRPPSFVNKFNVNRPKGLSAWDRFMKHRTATQLMKGKVRGLRIPGTDESGVPTYTHALGGYDWKQNFPDSPDWVDKGLAYGYQHLTEGTRALTDPTSYGTGIFGLAKNLGSAFNKANVEAAKNVEGFTGETIPPEDMQKYQTWQDLFARGGIAGLRTGFQGGGPRDWGQQERREGPYSPSNMSQSTYDRLQKISPSHGGMGGDGYVVPPHLREHIEPPDRRGVYGPSLPKGSRLGEPMFSTINQAKAYAKLLEEQAEEEERKRKDEEIAKTLAEMWHHDPGFEGKVGPVYAGINYEPEDPLGTYTIDAGIKTGPLSLGYSTGAELDDRYSLGVGFPTGGVGLLTDKGTGDVMGGGQISTGPYTIEGGYGTGGPEWALGVNINKPFSSRGLLKKRPKKVPAPYARGGILGAF